MKVSFVGGGPGDPDLLTVKALRLLQQCRCCIYAGSLVSPQVVAQLPADAALYDSAEMTLEQVIAVCRQAREQKMDVVRLHSGDPSIYGAIGEQMLELDKLGIDYEVVPGVSSFQAAAAALKTELTAPEISQTIILTRTAGRTPMPAEQELDRLAASQATLCLFLSVHKIDEFIPTLTQHYGSDCPVAVVYRVSWPDQKIVRGTLEDIAAKLEAEGIGRMAMIVVGRALRPGPAVSRLYSGEFSHGFRQATVS
jgi:precorrin-4/cobalt-precorrin-4 C11-methyltransferase